MPSGQDQHYIKYGGIRLQTCMSLSAAPSAWASQSGGGGVSANLSSLRYCTWRIKDRTLPSGPLAMRQALSTYGVPCFGDPRRREAGLHLGAKGEYSGVRSPPHGQTPAGPRPQHRSPANT